VTVISMYSSLYIKPHHVPILVAMTFVILIHDSDARMPKKHRPVTGKPQLLHYQKQHFVNTPPPSPPPPVSGSLLAEQVVAFSRHMYKDFAQHKAHLHGNNTLMSDILQDEFRQLNTYTNGGLSEHLSALFEIRLLDLQQSIRHARKMRDAVRQLSLGEEVDCVLCPPKSKE
jgi:hypothetical protein